MPAPLCPLCGESVQRIHRHLFDRVLSVVYPVRRYRCKRFRCGWEGTLKYRPKTKGHAEPGDDDS
jgi:predicted RNA-binding Zn-ribbon protein involved in translation (DUF1610 family)